MAPTQDLRKQDDAPEESGMDDEEEEGDNDEQEAEESDRRQKKSVPRGIAAKYEKPSVIFQFKVDVISQTSLQFGSKYQQNLVWIYVIFDLYF